MIHQTRLLAFTAAAFLVAPCFLHAQAFTPTGASAPLTPLFTSSAGHSIDAFDVDAAGDIFYLDRDTAPHDADGNLSTRLLERTAAGTTSVLFSFASNGFTQTPGGSFVRLYQNQIFWGESTQGTLWQGTLGVPGTLSGASQFGQIADNYDLRFNSSGQAYLSANPAGFQTPDNQIFRLNLAASGMVTTTNGASVSVDTGGDYSGPIAFDIAGNLLYGKSSGDVYRIPASQLNGSTPATLDPSYLLLSTEPNESFAGGSGGILYASGFSSDYSTSNLFSYDLASSSSSLLGSLDFNPEFFGAIGLSGDNLYVSVGDGSQTAIYSLPVPEPASALLLGIGSLCLLGRLRRTRSV